MHIADKQPPSVRSRRRVTLTQPASSLATRRAFSLVEVLLAIFILGIGMIMVASVFPVGANWTRQTAEESLGQIIAQDALSVIQRHYGRNGDLSPAVAPDFYDGSLGPNNVSNFNSVLKSGPAPFGPGISPFVLQALPFFTSIPLQERAYQFGSNTPFPASDPQVCTYFWTALVRLNTAHMDQRPPPPGPGPLLANQVLPSATYKYDLFILVFHKGSRDQKFRNYVTAGIEVPGLRNFTSVLFDESYVPSVIGSPYSPGVYDPSASPPMQWEFPHLGDIGIGYQSGTVFRQMLHPNVFTSSTGAPGIPRPVIKNYDANLYKKKDPTLSSAGPTEQILYCPPANGTGTPDFRDSTGTSFPPVGASPLIYVYQTTLTF